MGEKVNNRNATKFTAVRDCDHPPNAFSFATKCMYFRTVMNYLLLCCLVVGGRLSRGGQVPGLLLLMVAKYCLLSVPVDVSHARFFRAYMFLLFLNFTAVRGRRLGLGCLGFVFVMFVSFIVLVVSNINRRNLSIFVGQFRKTGGTRNKVSGMLKKECLKTFFQTFGGLSVPVLNCNVKLKAGINTRLVNNGVCSFNFGTRRR